MRGRHAERPRRRSHAEVPAHGRTARYVIDDGYLRLAPARLPVYALAGYGSLFCFTDESTFLQGLGDANGVAVYEGVKPYECTRQELAAMVAAAG